MEWERWEWYSWCEDCGLDQFRLMSFDVTRHSWLNVFPAWSCRCLFKECQWQSSLLSRLA